MYIDCYSEREREREREKLRDKEERNKKKTLEFDCGEISHKKKNLEGGSL